MTGLVRKATLLTLCGVLFAGAAMAGVPSAATSSKPACIALVGLKAGVSDPAGQFLITVRDIANNTVPFVDVYVDFAGCLPGVDNHVGVQASQGFAGIVVGPANQVHATTSNLGVATFRIVGSAQNAGGSVPRAGAGCAKVYAGTPPVLLGSVTVNTYNEDGSLGAVGVGGNDLSVWVADFFSPGLGYAARSDFDCNATVGGNDLSLLVNVFFLAGSGQGAAANAW